MPVVVFNKHMEYDASWCDEVVNVMRPNVLGNPFRISPTAPREKVIAIFREWLQGRAERDAVIKAELHRLADIHAAGGTVGLVCCCSPLPCHADVIKAKIQSMEP